MRRASGWKAWTVACCWLALGPPLAAQQAGTAAECTAKDRTSLAITLYNSNFSLVSETRQVNLPAGTVQLAFEDVPSSIEPATAHLGATPGLEVIEQAYKFNLLDSESLLARYVGKRVTLVFREQENGTTRDRDVEATLLSTRGPVWKIGNNFVTGLHPDGYRFPELPSQLYASPTLVWTLQNSRAGERRLAATYLANQMNWEANYSLNLAPEGKEGSLDGWVTLTNSSGASFENAALSLVAGAVHRAPMPSAGPMFMATQAVAANAVDAAQQFVQAPIGEYHLYTLNRRISLGNGETKQIRLLSAAKVPVEQSYVVEGQPNLYRYRQPEGAPAKQAVAVYLTFHNNAAAGLGQPLPAGTVRVYQPDSQGHLILLGQDQINHTPKDEPVRLEIGSAFDIMSERTQTDFQQAGSVYESAFDIMLHNHKDKAVTVEVREPANGNWEVLKSNFPAKKLDAFTLGFDVPVPANGDAKLSYRVRVTY